VNVAEALLLRAHYLLPTDPDIDALLQHIYTLDGSSYKQVHTCVSVSASIQT
jgi:hypothetical protein